MAKNEFFEKPFYFGNFSASDAAVALSSKPNGSFLARTNHEGFIVISFVAEKDVRHEIVDTRDDGVKWRHGAVWFDTVDEFIDAAPYDLHHPVLKQQSVATNRSTETTSISTQSSQQNQHDNWFTLLFQGNHNVIVDSVCRLPVFASASVAGDFVFVSGTLGTVGVAPKLIDGGIENETRQTLYNIARILKSCGCSLNQIVKVNVYLRDVEDFNTMNQVYKKIMGENPPARITVGKAGLALNAAVEIDCIAYRGSTFATRFTKSIALLGGVVAGLYVAQKLLSDQM